MEEWRIEFVMDKNLDKAFIRNFFNFLISKGVKYNAAIYPGSFQILGNDTDKDIEYKETSIKDSTEKLTEIIDTYLKFDLETTHLTINLNYCDDAYFYFWSYIIPIEGRCLITFGSGNHLVQDEKTYMSFVNLCKEVFNRFNFIYGAFRNEYQGNIPLSVNNFLKESPDNVNFYSRPVVDRIGREKILSAPAFKVEELENDAIMLIVCPGSGDCDALISVAEYFGFYGYRGPDG